MTRRLPAAPSARRTLALFGAVLLTACGGGEAASDTSAASAPPPDAAARPADSAATTATAAPAAPATEPAAADTGMLDPNAAARDALAAVPGMTPAAADALVAGRPYADMVAVDRVLAQHLGEPVRDTVYARLWKPIDLNKATAQEILLIPGVGPRMRHEFEEYRPYRSMEQFRREIGKYVNDQELERLARYVSVR